MWQGYSRSIVCNRQETNLMPIDEGLSLINSYKSILQNSIQP